VESIEKEAIIITGICFLA